jgi:hypothetical protein
MALDPKKRREIILAFLALLFLAGILTATLALRKDQSAPPRTLLTPEELEGRLSAPQGTPPPVDQGIIDALTAPVKQ